MVFDSEKSERRYVLVFIDRSDMPDVEITPYGTSLENSRIMNKWFESKSLLARETICKLGGVVLEQNWFWSGLRAELPLEDIEAAMSMINDMPNVRGVHYPQ